MNICIHGEAAKGCPWRKPWGRFWGCSNIRREIYDIEFCGKTVEECKGRHDPYLGKKNGNTS